MVIFEIEVFQTSKNEEKRLRENHFARTAEKESEKKTVPLRLKKLSPIIRRQARFIPISNTFFFFFPSHAASSFERITSDVRTNIKNDKRKRLAKLSKNRATNFDNI